MPTNPSAPISDIDLYDERVLLDPYPAYRTLRDLGPAVWLEKYGMYVLARFKNVQEAMRDWQTFTSAQGVMMNQRMNDTLRGIVLCSDDPEHQVLRRVIAKPITPLAIKAYQDLIASEAEALVERLVARKHFDAAKDLAQYLPVTIVSNLVGLPEDGRERMLDWAAANFECFGPINDRTTKAFEIVKEMVDYAFTHCTREKLKPDGWARAIWDAADRGEIPLDRPPLMMNDYMGPSLDTTIFTTSSAIWLFAQHPSNGMRCERTQRSSRMPSTKWCDWSRRCRASPASVLSTSTSRASSFREARGSSCCGDRRTATSENGRTPPNSTSAAATPITWVLDTVCMRASACTSRRWRLARSFGHC